MQNLNKVIYAFGLATLLYLAEEAGRKKGYKQGYDEGLDYCADSLLTAALNNPNETLGELISKYKEYVRRK